MEVEMGLSNYQGTPMSIHYAHKKYDETELSKQELAVLSQKHKSKSVQYKKGYNQSKKWESVQERSNEISMRCLGFKYQREDKQNEL